MEVLQKKTEKKEKKEGFKSNIKDSFVNYEHALEKLVIETWEARREKLSLKFALKCQNSSHAKDLFKYKIKLHHMKLRSTKTYEVYKFNTKRYENSAILYMQNLLNKNFKENQENIES